MSRSQVAASLQDALHYHWAAKCDDRSAFAGTDEFEGGKESRSFARRAIVAFNRAAEFASGIVGVVETVRNGRNLEAKILALASRCKVDAQRGEVIAPPVRPLSSLVVGDMLTPAEVSAHFNGGRAGARARAHDIATATNIPLVR